MVHAKTAHHRRHLVDGRHRERRPAQPDRQLRDQRRDHRPRLAASLEEIFRLDETQLPRADQRRVGGARRLPALHRVRAQPAAAAALTGRSRRPTTPPGGGILVNFADGRLLDDPDGVFHASWQSWSRSPEQATWWKVAAEHPSWSSRAGGAGPVPALRGHSGRGRLRRHRGRGRRRRGAVRLHRGPAVRGGGGRAPTASRPGGPGDGARRGGVRLGRGQRDRHPHRDPRGGR